MAFFFQLVFFLLCFLLCFFFDSDLVFLFPLKHCKSLSKRKETM